MRKARYWYLAGFTLVLAAMVALGAGAGTSVGQDGYGGIVGSVTASPASACIGGTTNLTGTGMAPNSQIQILLNYLGQGQVLTDSLGTTTTDGSGNWTKTVTVPATAQQVVSTEVGTQTVPMFAGQWTVVAATEGALYVSTGDLTVLDCSALPSTGFPMLGAGLMGSGLLLTGGTGLLVRRRRRR